MSQLYIAFISSTDRSYLPGTQGNDESALMLLRSIAKAHYYLNVKKHPVR